MCYVLFAVTLHLNNIYKYAQAESRVYLNVEHDGQNANIIFRNMSAYPLEMSPEELELLQSTVAINQYLSAEKTREILADLEHKKPFDCRERFLYTAFADPKLKNHATDIFASLSVIRDSIRKKKKLSILDRKSVV